MFVSVIVIVISLDRWCTVSTDISDA